MGSQGKGRDNQDGYEFALSDGPRLIHKHYLSVHPWKADFDPDDEVTKITAWVWIIRTFPLNYYHGSILYVVSNQIGRVLKVDINTLRRVKGRFARLYV
ncbi:hypothetical protein K1719_005985 [Acacia pycnantha]|nr:hypothetical protein K1719_005985 [Acacia pycnantha]